MQKGLGGRLSFEFSYTLWWKPRTIPWGSNPAASSKTISLLEASFSIPTHWELSLPLGRQKHLTNHYHRRNNRIPNSDCTWTLQYLIIFLTDTLFGYYISLVSFHPLQNSWKLTNLTRSSRIFHVSFVMWTPWAIFHAEYPPIWSGLLVSN